MNTTAREERGPYVTADAAWDALATELQYVEPPCDGRALFTAARLTPEQRDACAALCATCPVFDLCENYATAARVDFGFWAGHSYTRKGKR
jgi:hypothetical protein